MYETPFYRSREFWLEFTVALSLSALLWCVAAPWAGTTINAGWLVAIVCVTYAASIVVLFNLATVANILIGDRYYPKTVATVYYSLCLLVPFLPVAVLGLIFPSLVTIWSYWALFGIVTAGTLTRFALYWTPLSGAFEKAREADNAERAAPRLTAVVTRADGKHKVFRAKRNGEAGKLIILREQELKSISRKLSYAYERYQDGQTVDAEETIVEAIPQLANINRPKRYLIDVAYIVLEQSAEHYKTADAVNVLDEIRKARMRIAEKALTGRH